LKASWQISDLDVLLQGYRDARGSGSVWPFSIRGAQPDGVSAVEQRRGIESAEDRREFAVPEPDANCTQTGVSPSLPELRLYSNFQVALLLMFCVHASPVA